MSPSPATVRTADLRARLRHRYTGKNPNGVEYAYLEEVSSHVQGGGRYCDALAVGLWGSRGHALFGHEIKATRSDWQRELEDLAKADAFIPYCQKWWIVAPAGVVHEDELPPLWGLLVPNQGKGLKALVQAPQLDPEPIPMSFLAAIVRRAIQAGSESEAIESAVEAERERLEKQAESRKWMEERRDQELREANASLDALRDGLGDRWVDTSPESMQRLGSLAAAAYSSDKKLEAIRFELTRWANSLRNRADDLETLAKAPDPDIAQRSDGESR